MGAISEPILFPRERRSPRGPRRRLVGVVVLVCNEQHVLERSVRGLHDFLKTGLSYDFVRSPTMPAPTGLGTSRGGWPTRCRRSGPST
ncbi:hypothetical protein amrb99_14330 [Actinomadura sp. RB99]|uniref:hypothetical protein n=1 Tax=Actinomadura sp. RB99 TaxID=2691577 RepID=UPI001982E7C3|nr:hypothetical protein [Actinomadura sp. RB99]